MKQIPLFKPKFETEACLQEIRDCLEKGWTGVGYKTIAFEDAWKEYTGHKNAFFINSNTSGLILALEILKQEEGWSDTDEVITTPLTFVATNHAILRAGLCPVFADVDDTLCMDAASLKEHITERTKAVMFVGYGGHIGQLENIITLCRENDLRLILDAAHMAGTRVRGEVPGTWGGGRGNRLFFSCSKKSTDRRCRHDLFCR